MRGVSELLPVLPEPTSEREGEAASGGKGLAAYRSALQRQRREKKNTKRSRR